MNMIWGSNIRPINHLLLIFVLTVTAGLTGNVNASLIEQDLFSSDDALITLDTDTGLRWLDVTATQGESITDILADKGGWMSMGFEYASLSDVQKLASNAGVDTFSAVNIRLAENVSGVSQLISLLGNVGTSSPTVDASRGYAANPDNTIPFEHISFGLFNDLGLASALHSPVAGDISIPNIFVGHFLVQRVPEPASFLLMAVGLVGLGFVLRQKQA